MPPQRKKRTPPDRHGPTRRGSSPTAARGENGNGDAPPSRAAGPYSYGDAIDRGLEAARLVVDAVDATARGAVERGVETAYAVVDEYIRRGRTAASHRRSAPTPTSANTATTGGPVPPASNGYQGGGASDAANGAFSGAFNGAWGNAAANPLFAPWFQMMRLWTDNMMSFMPTGGANPLAMWTAAMQPRPAVAVRTSSRQPVEVTIQLDPGAEWFMLRVDPLVNLEQPNSPTLTPPSIACEPGRVTVNVTLSPTESAGRFTGTIRDSSGVRRGELCVSVEAPTAAATQPV